MISTSQSLQHKRILRDCIINSPATVLPFQVAGVWFRFSARGQHSSVAALPAAGSGTPGTSSAVPAALPAAPPHPELEEIYHSDCVCGGGREAGREAIYWTAIQVYYLSLLECTIDEVQCSYMMKGKRSISLIGTGPVGGRGAKDEEPSLNTDTAVEWSAEKK